MAASFAGKVALVTGGASGIGRAAALAFAREGAKVVISTDANIQGGEETVRMIESDGGEAIFVKCDVAKASESFRPVLATCLNEFGNDGFNPINMAGGNVRP